MCNNHRKYIIELWPPCDKYTSHLWTFVYGSEECYCLHLFLITGHEEKQTHSCKWAGERRVYPSFTLTVFGEIRKAGHVVQVLSMPEVDKSCPSITYARFTNTLKGQPLFYRPDFIPCGGVFFHLLLEQSSVKHSLVMCRALNIAFSLLPLFLCKVSQCENIRQPLST